MASSSDTLFLPRLAQLSAHSWKTGSRVPSFGHFPDPPPSRAHEAPGIFSGGANGPVAAGVGLPCSCVAVAQLSRPPLTDVQAEPAFLGWAPSPGEPLSPSGSTGPCAARRAGKPAWCGAPHTPSHVPLPGLCSKSRGTVAGGVASSRRSSQHTPSCCCVPRRRRRGGGTRQGLGPLPPAATTRKGWAGPPQLPRGMGLRRGEHGRSCQERVCGASALGRSASKRRNDNGCSQRSWCWWC